MRRPVQRNPHEGDAMRGFALGLAAGGYTSGMARAIGDTHLISRSKPLPLYPP